MDNLDFKEPDFKKELTSDFNEAKYQIYRIHLLLDKCHKYSAKGNLKEYKWILDRLWIELVADARAKGGGKTEKDLKNNEYFKKFEEINLKIVKAGENNDELYFALQEKEMYLRFLQDDVGKGSKRRNVDDDDFD